MGLFSRKAAAPTRNDYAALEVRVAKLEAVVRALEMDVQERHDKMLAWMRRATAAANQERRGAEAAELPQGMEARPVATPPRWGARSRFGSNGGGD